MLQNQQLTLIHEISGLILMVKIMKATLCSKVHLFIIVMLSSVMMMNGALASALPMSYQTLNDGTNNVTSGSGANTTVAVPSSWTYGDTFPSAPGFSITGLPSGSPTFNFYDHFLFNVAASNLNSITSTIDFGSLLSISDLQVRLYSGNTVILGNPGSSLVQAWSSPLSAGQFTGTVNVLNATLGAPGSYILEVRGNVTGTFGGSYAGVLNVAPVPVPGAVYLLGSSLVAMLGVSRRKKAA
jgi:hypothetical protein